MPNNQPNLRGALKLREAARYLGLSERTLLRLIKRGFIAPIRVTRHLLFSIRELDRFLNDPGNTTRFWQLAPQNTREGCPRIGVRTRRSNLLGIPNQMSFSETDPEVIRKFFFSFRK
jgi:excisionase family DNA binding protein